jgi:hypothetical protein
MNFPSLPGHHNAQKRANLERAFEEIAYYSRRMWQSGSGKRGITPEQMEAIKSEIENATPETAGEIFKTAWRLCQNLEKILSTTHEK